MDVPYSTVLHFDSHPVSGCGSMHATTPPFMHMLFHAQVDSGTGGITCDKQDWLQPDLATWSSHLLGRSAWCGWACTGSGRCSGGKRQPRNHLADHWKPCKCA